jgi:CheY-like chemotaxis protein
MNAERRILIVDDDPIYAKSTKAVLESHGYQVDLAQNGEEALAQMRQARPDLVILDVMMDWVLDGVTVSQEMMSEKELQPIPIIMVTAIRDSEYLGLFPQDQYLHINCWLDKPCPPDKLLSEIEKTFTRREKYRQAS